MFRINVSSGLSTFTKRKEEERWREKEGEEKKKNVIQIYKTGI